jgi:hypothetical protein
MVRSTDATATGGTQPGSGRFRRDRLASQIRNAPAAMAAGAEDPADLVALLPVLADAQVCHVLAVVPDEVVGQPGLQLQHELGTLDDLPRLVGWCLRQDILTAREQRGS